MKKHEYSHFPDFTPGEDGLVSTGSSLDILALCMLSFFAEALDLRSYIAPGQDPSRPPNMAQQKVLNDLGVNSIKASERQEIWLARGCAIECMTWFHCQFKVMNTNTNPSQICDLPATVMHWTAIKLLRYLKIAQLKCVRADGNALYDAVKQELESSLGLYPSVISYWQDSMQKGRLSSGLQCSSKGALSDDGWMRECIIGDGTGMKIQRRDKEHIMPRRSLVKLQEMGMRDRDRHYIKAKEEDKTVTL